jgi:hypothetical protein
MTARGKNGGAVLWARIIRSEPRHIADVRNMATSWGNAMGVAVQWQIVAGGRLNNPRMAREYRALTAANA